MLILPARAVSVVEWRREECHRAAADNGAYQSENVTVVKTRRHIVQPDRSVTSKASAAGSARRRQECEHLQRAESVTIGRLAT
jgi:hypothetical protein